MKNASTTNIIGCMLDGRLEPSDAVQMLSTRLLDDRDRVIFIAARSIAYRGEEVNVENIIKYIKNDGWVSPDAAESYKSYMGYLIQNSHI